jgi:hypothetical protein
VRVDVSEIAGVLGGWWPLVAGPAPNNPAARVVWQHRPGWWPPAPVPGEWLLWDAAVDEPTQHSAGSPPTSSAKTAPAGLRMLYPRAVTKGRPSLVLPRAPAEPSSPAAASRVCTYALTARAVAELLDERAGRTGAPFRSLRGEADAYRAAADEQAALLGEATGGWLQDAYADLAAAARTPLPPVRSPVPTVPGQFRR